MENVDKELLKVLLEVAKAISTIIGAILMIALLWFRSRDKKAHDDQLSRVEGKLEVLTQGFDETVTKSQALSIVDSVYSNMDSVLHCWFCGYIRSGKPEMTAGEWNLDLVIKSQRLLVKERLDVFVYNKQSLGSFVEEEGFKKLCAEFKKGIKTFNNTEGIAKYITNKLDELKMEVKDRL